MAKSFWDRIVSEAPRSTKIITDAEHRVFAEIEYGHDKIALVTIRRSTDPNGSTSGRVYPIGEMLAFYETAGVGAAKSARKEMRKHRVPTEQEKIAQFRKAVRSGEYTTAND